MLALKKKFLFVHIPKVAGQSIEKTLMAIFDDLPERNELLLKPNLNPLKGPPRLAHLTAQEYIRCGYIDQASFDNIYKFAFVRNPWERLVSEFNYRKSLGLEKYQCSFRRFVMDGFPTKFDDDYVNARDLFRHVIPQSSFLFDKDGELLVDFIGRFERLQADFSIVCKKLGVEETELMRENITKLQKSNSFFAWLANRFIKDTSKDIKQHYSQYYDNETEQKVAELYRQDIVNFGYTFEAQN
ncbi:sulfotransferase family 2 domain-containing protein [Thalassotalea euphylliae]|uniref:sulfotransferase family 2 domain-containing protein n=1 Tax=Thalassotalea euphylliae TaxID=1655234 RepID=UPI003643692D